LSGTRKADATRLKAAIWCRTAIKSGRIDGWTSQTTWNTSPGTPSR
jgi:hypothetical protein